MRLVRARLVAIQPEVVAPFLRARESFTTDAASALSGSVYALLGGERFGLE
jgi:hypothetical protein